MRPDLAFQCRPPSRGIPQRRAGSVGRWFYGPSSGFTWG